MKHKYNADGKSVFSYRNNFNVMESEEEYIRTKFINLVCLSLFCLTTILITRSINKLIFALRFLLILVFGSTY